MRMAVTELSKENFSTFISNNEKLVLVDFWASWCGPCRILSPVVDEIANEMAGKIKVGKCNVDDNSELAMQFQVMSIPTLILFQEGKPIQTLVGAQPKEAVVAELSKFL